MATDYLQTLQDKANQIRIHSIRSTSEAGSGHVTSSCSMAEITSVLFFDIMRYDPKNPQNPNNDRFVLSKGHASPGYYAAWAEAGLFPREDLMKLRQIDSDLEGHPTPRLDFADAATGSLGQGLSVGCGIAYAGKYLEEGKYRVYVMIGDGEAAEGAIWEAIDFASHYQLNNLVAVFDVNRLGQSEPTKFGHDLDVYRRRLEAFGWDAVVVDGHDVKALKIAFEKAAESDSRPTAIVAQTIKGKGIPEVEDKEGFHGKPLEEGVDEAVERLKKQIVNTSPVEIHPPEGNVARKPAIGRISIPRPAYSQDDKEATRTAFGTALSKLGEADERIVSLDGDVKGSTRSKKFLQNDSLDAHRFIECFIAEQNMVGAALGLSARGYIPFVATFGAFLSRASDQIRMAGISQANIKFSGSHAGISIGEDGPSQMALEDLALFRAIPGSTVFYPSDGVSAERAVELCAGDRGIAYIRTTRPKTPILYGNEEDFEIGRAKVVRSTPQDQALVVAAGATLFEALAAAEALAGQGLSIRVIDPFTIKPIDREALARNAQETGGTVITVEDHYPEGGIGDAVAEAIGNEADVRLHRMAVNGLPRSGDPDALFERYGISSRHIIEKVKSVIGE